MFYSVSSPYTWELCWFSVGKSINLTFSTPSGTQRRLILVTTSDHGSRRLLLLLCRTYNRDVSSSKLSCFGFQSSSSEPARTSIRFSCSWLFISRMRLLLQSATNKRPSASRARYAGSLTSANVDSTLPRTSTSLTCIASHTVRVHFTVSISLFPIILTLT